MGARYFLYIKPESDSVADDTKTQIIDPNARRVFLLPRNNMTYYAEQGLFEKHLMDWCLQFVEPSKVFLDIGAHTGTYTLSLAHNCKTVHSFEPQRDTFYALCGSVALSGLKNVECHRVGLGDPSQVGEMKLKIVSDDGGGSSLHDSGLSILSEETINVRTLDSFNLDSIGFIKMDVENNELSVLKGGVETLKRSGYPRILFESNWENPKLFEFVKGLGYSVVQVAGVNNMYLAHRE